MRIRLTRKNGKLEKGVRLIRWGKSYGRDNVVWKRDLKGLEEYTEGKNIIGDWVLSP